MTKRILIVDDEPNLAFFLAENLVDLGPDYHIETCNSGAEALALNKARPFDLIITDWMMPGITGLRLMKFLKEQQPTVKLILMTAYGNDAIALKAKEVGITKYVAKPFDIDEMMVTVEQLLSNNNDHETDHSQNNNNREADPQLTQRSF